jgi:hypothetical protein
MPSVPSAAIPNPITPPMIECVVETGIPTRVAKVRYTEDATTAHTMPSIKREGSLIKRFVSTILVRIVSETRAPTPTAPVNSMTAAIHIAWR